MFARARCSSRPGRGFVCERVRQAASQRTERRVMQGCCGREQPTVTATPSHPDAATAQELFKNSRAQCTSAVMAAVCSNCGYTGTVVWQHFLAPHNGLEKRLCITDQCSAYVTVRAALAQYRVETMTTSQA